MRMELSPRFSVLAYSRKLGNFLSFSVYRFILLRVNNLINPLLFLVADFFIILLEKMTFFA